MITRDLARSVHAYPSHLDGTRRSWKKKLCSWWTLEQTAHVCGVYDSGHGTSAENSDSHPVETPCQGHEVRVLFAAIDVQRFDAHRFAPDGQWGRTRHPPGRQIPRRQSGATRYLTRRREGLMLHANTLRDYRLLAPVAEVRQYVSEEQLERDIWQKMLPNLHQT